jgi:steroid 5-alpha reductase family enzyme
MEVLYMNYNQLSKKKSGIVFLVVYIFAMLLGIMIASFGKNNNFNPILTMLIADIFMTLIVFLIGSVLKNASLYDPYWSVIPLFIVIVWMIYYFQTINLASILLVIAILFWSIR